MHAPARSTIAARDISSVIHQQTDLVLHRSRGPNVITTGEGIYIQDETLGRLMDVGSGLWCATLGFSSKRLAKVAHDQMATLGYYHLYRHTTNVPVVELAEKLLAIAPVPMSKVLFQNSGSEANDTAIKLAWYYQAAQGKPEKRKIIARRMAYHGSTCVSISASGKADMHADFGLPFAEFKHTEYPNYYRNHFEGETEEEFSTRMADAFEQLILREGPETVAAFIAEPVMGAGGGLVPPRTYWEKMQKVVKKYDLLFIVDEVICGFGRTGNMWGSTTYKLEPDIVTCAKALSAGMMPISAVLVNERVYDAMLSESRKLGSFAHGFTYAGHPVAAAVALEVQRIYEEMDVVARTRELGACLEESSRILKDHPLVGDVRGVGLFLGIDIVSDTKTRRPFEKDMKIPALLETHTRQQGLLARIIGDRVVFAPAFIITPDEIRESMRRMRAALDSIYQDISGARA